VHFSADLNAHALVGSGKVGFRLYRRTAKDQTYGDQEKNLCQAVKKMIMISHIGSDLKS
jgi:hypothetical protein